MVTVKFFGTSGAVPSLNRGFACIGLLDGSDITLLDCGDGSIFRLLKYNVEVNNISNILVTHFHSDHVTGITQIIETMGIRRRKSELNIYAPTGLRDYFSSIEGITRVASHRTFKVNINELSPKTSVKIGNYAVATFEMDHTLPCVGYRIESNGKVISYTGDTQSCDGAVKLGASADFFIHEATFLPREIELARQTKHSTPRDAAQTANSAGAKRLFLTHINDAHETEQEVLKESKAFRDVTVAYDGLEFPVE